MVEAFMATFVTKANERGSARLKFLIVIAILAIIAYAGNLYIPVAYNAYRFKDLMQHDADVAATQGYPASWVKDQLTKAGPEFGIPPDATITPTQHDNRVEVSVQYSLPIEFPGYTYQYNFDYTARSSTFLTFK
jgi:Ca2+/H+ antiporter